MIDLSLQQFLNDDRSHTVCFDESGREVDARQFRADVTRFAAELAGRDGERWVVDLEHAGRFAAAFAGCLLAGKTPVVGPAPLMRDDAVRLSADGYIVADAKTETNGNSIVYAAAAEANAAAKFDLPVDGKVALFTSGSTGSPKQIMRRFACMEAEVSTFEACWGSLVGANRFHATVSHRHVYGLLFRILWPLLSRRPFAVAELKYPEQLVNDRSHGETLVASPAILERLGFLDRQGSWAAVFSSGGLLRFEVARLANSALGTTPIEVLGSTETSGVAWRAQTDVEHQRWRLLPRVSMSVDTEDFIQVKSPYCGIRDWTRMGDLGVLHDDGSFTLLGRGDHVAKIEGKRVSLSEIETRLRATQWVADSAAVALQIGSRQSIGVVLVLTDSGLKRRRELGNHRFGLELRAGLETIEPVARPRHFRYVDTIPVNSQGKRTRDALERLFDHS